MNTVNVLFQRGTKAEIDEIPISDGQVLWTTDQTNNDKIYTDVGDKRIRIGGTLDVDNEVSTTSQNPVTNAAITNYVNTEITNTNNEIIKKISPAITPTYIVDSNQKLMDWANNVKTSGQNYKIVLIKNGTWDLTKTINFEVCGTHRVIGECYTDTILNVNIPLTEPYNETTNSAFYNSPNTNIVTTIENLGFNIKNGLYGIVNCSNIENVSFFPDKAFQQNSGFTCFYKCNNLNNCISLFMTTSSNDKQYGYINCSKVINSIGSFKHCNHLSNCGIDFSNMDSSFSGIFTVYYSCENLTNCCGYYYESCSYLNNCTSSNLVGIFTEDPEELNKNYNCDILNRYKNCSYLTNCKANFYIYPFKGTDENYFKVYFNGFEKCIGITNCLAQMDGDISVVPSNISPTITGFDDCRGVGHCRALMNVLVQEPSGIARKSGYGGLSRPAYANTETSLCSDTANGGFNYSLD